MFPFRRFTDWGPEGFFAPAAPDLLCSGLMVANRTDTASPAAKIFLLALISRSWCVPQLGQSHSRIFNGIFSAIYPQLLHRLELGNHLSRVCWKSFSWGQGVGFGRELSVRPSVRLSSRGGSTGSPSARLSSPNVRGLTPRSERVWGFTSFEVTNYLIFREKVPKFFPDHSHIHYFWISKRSKSFTQQGF
jgi:hypothetical protein